MKIPYQQPDTQVVTLFTRSGVLITGSNENWVIDDESDLFSSGAPGMFDSIN